ncbi:ATP-dependent DNA ligase [Enemella evansiae]|uniref:ATP-dependent DNA ligase n=1 Tax=Enemella evansiae TaxID=2016499 RepID=UPI00105F1493|nr:ATP-dependent DNA ligase [Enemella evansiae]TDO86030.1 DNA ligase-1 [Enemella evansiae]
MLLQEVADTSAAVAATRSRNAKRDLLAELLRRTPAEDLEIVVVWLAGELRQRRTGVGWASLSTLPDPAAEPSLEVTAVDAELERVAGLAGPGSQLARRQAMSRLFGAATAGEQRLLRGLLSGEVRQGALDAAILDAVAAASGVPMTELRRAVTVRGATAPVAVAALTGGSEAVAAFGVQVGQGVRPMLASSAPDVPAALEKLGDRWSLDTKLDGIRIQAHRGADGVRLFTRSLDDITDRLPEVAAIVAALPGGDLVLDGEVLAHDAAGKPRPFQDTAARSATLSPAPEAGAGLVPAFFDVLHADGASLLDRPLVDRLAVLDRLVPREYRIRRADTTDPQEAARFFEQVVADGHEGVVLKDLDAPYAAGRRGAAWIKVKPRHTLDLVVLAVERGSGRRRGWLSNIHLGARDPEGRFGPPGGFVMVGKTFKGMTDEMLRWQTERFTDLAVDEGDWVVTVRPEQVVEIALDGVQRSRRYPGGVALRFARVVRYRDDKPAGEADTISDVRALGEG